MVKLFGIHAECLCICNLSYLTIHLTSVKQGNHTIRSLVIAIHA